MSYWLKSRRNATMRFYGTSLEASVEVGILSNHSQLRRQRCGQRELSQPNQVRVRRGMQRASSTLLIGFITAIEQCPRAHRWWMGRIRAIPYSNGTVLREPSMRPKPWFRGCSLVVIDPYYLDLISDRNYDVAKGRFKQFGKSNGSPSLSR